MTNRTNSVVYKLAVATAVVTLSACSSTGGILQGDRIDYQSATKKSSPNANLEVPPDLSQISRDNRFSIPESGGSTTITASGFAAKSAANGSSSTNTTSTGSSQPIIAPLSSQGMHMERAGSQRWLVVNQSPEVLWPKIHGFWEENGFVIKEESQTTGVMETDWAENRAKIPMDFIRRALGSVLDSLYSTSERDKFRTRLERRPDGSTEIYISQRGAEEILTGTDKDSSKWASRPNDPGLEAAFLTRLMVSLGAPKEKANELIKTPLIQAAQAQVVQDGSLSTVRVNESFDRAWRRVGLALDRVGFTVEDRDRTQGIYYVRYINQDADGNGGGFFSKIFGEKEKDAKRYRVVVKGQDSTSQVSIQNNEGLAENSATSTKILNLLSDQLK